MVELWDSGDAESEEGGTFVHEMDSGQYGLMKSRKMATGSLLANLNDTHGSRISPLVPSSPLLCYRDGADVRVDHHFTAVHSRELHVVISLYTSAEVLVVPHVLPQRHLVKLARFCSETRRCPSVPQSGTVVKQMTACGGTGTSRAIISRADYRSLGGRPFVFAVLTRWKRSCRPKTHSHVPVSSSQ
jgi:hypothetical protein